MISRNNKQILTIITLMIITGFIIYYFYFKIENFETTSGATTTTTGATTTTTGATTTTTGATTTTTGATTTNISCPQITTPTVPIVYKSIISKESGIGFNIEMVGTNYIIKHIPINNSEVFGSVYAVDRDYLLTLKPRNNNDLTQRWDIIKNPNGTDYQVFPHNITNKALQYSNGVLNVVPYDGTIRDSIKWILSTNIINRGIPVLNVNPNAMYGTEFNPAGYSSGISQESISQISDVLDAVKSGIQQYLNQALANNRSSGGSLSSSSLGTRDTPLPITVNFGRPSGETFDNLTNNTSDVLTLLDRYDASKNPTTDYLFSLSDLNKQLSNKGCQQINLNDYIPNRVGSCNCKL